MKLTVYNSNLVLIEGEVEEAYQHARRAPLYPFSFIENSNRYEDLIRSPEGNQFSGGTYQSLFTMPDMTPFTEAKEALARSGLMQRITQKTENFNRRRRTLSEHDGEWDLSRRWEVQPFARAKRIPVPNKIVDIECHINVSYLVNAADISRYGCMVWAVNDIIESCGIATSIKIIAESISTDNAGTCVKFIWQIKKPGEYVNPMYIARTLTSNFIRRIGFSWFVIGCDIVGTKADSGLGKPVELTDNVTFKNGKLIITSEAIRTPSEQDIQTSIIQAITGDKKCV